MPGTSRLARVSSRHAPSAKKATIPETIAERVIRFIETQCRYPEGKLVGELIVLPTLHKEAIRGIYEEVAGCPGLFKHYLSIISWPRKCAKSGLMASLLICHLCGPVAVRNSQLYSCALAKDQAAVIYRYAMKMVQMNSELSDRIRVRESIKTMSCPGTGVLFRVLASDEKRLFGLAPQCVYYDETGQVRGSGPGAYPTWDAMDTARGTCFNSIAVIISTQSASDDDFLSVLMDDAANDPGVFVMLRKCPDDIDPLDPDRLGDWFPVWNEPWVNQDYIRKQQERAKRLPSARATFLNLFANKRVRAEAGLFDAIAWEACNDSIDWTKAVGRRAYGALDLSITTDITAWVLCVEMDDGTIGVKCMFFIPAAGLAERELRDKVPYQAWADAGLLILCPGEVVDYAFVMEQILDDAAVFDIVEIAYDRYRIKVLRKAALDADITLPTLVEHGQGYVSMAPSITELENVVLAKKLRHGGHPILRNHILNAIITKDPAANRKFDKSKRTHRIDGAVTLTMAIGQMKRTATIPADTAGMIG